jgi:hypothetical protein
MFFNRIFSIAILTMLTCVVTIAIYCSNGELHAATKTIDLNVLNQSLKEENQDWLVQGITDTELTLSFKKKNLEHYRLDIPLESIFLTGLHEYEVKKQKRYGFSMTCADFVMTWDNVQCATITIKDKSEPTGDLLFFSHIDEGQAKAIHRQLKELIGNRVTGFMSSKDIPSYIKEDSVSLKVNNYQILFDFLCDPLKLKLPECVPGFKLASKLKLKIERMPMWELYERIIYSTGHVFKKEVVSSAIEVKTKTHFFESLASAIREKKHKSIFNNWHLERLVLVGNIVHYTQYTTKHFNYKGPQVISREKKKLFERLTVKTTYFNLNDVIIDVVAAGIEVICKGKHYCIEAKARSESLLTETSIHNSGGRSKTTLSILIDHDFDLGPREYLNTEAGIKD